MSQKSGAGENRGKNGVKKEINKMYNIAWTRPSARNDKTEKWQKQYNM